MQVYIGNFFRPACVVILARWGAIGRFVTVKGNLIALTTISQRTTLQVPGGKGGTRS